MTICDDVQKTTDIKLSPQHLFCASLLSRIAELVSSAPQEVINATIKVSASNIHKMLKLEGYLKDNYSSFEELIMDINRAFEFCDDLNVVSNDDDCVEVVLCDKICGCKYCPKTIGEAEIDGSACPIPILFEQIGKKEGFDYSAVKIEDSYVIKKCNSCIIRFSKSNNAPTRKNTWREALYM
jgi:hypothetical protein